MKYKAGDKVRIVNHRTPRMNSNGDMDEYLGTIMTIKKIYLSSYIMAEDNGEWSWFDEMIEGLADEDISLSKLSRVNGFYVINW